MRYGFTLWLLVLLLLVGAPAAAQQAAVVSIEPGTVEGNISDAFSSQRYSIQLRSSETTVIRMERTSGDLDPYLYLSDADQQLIDENDDASDGDRSAEITFTPESDGQFIVEATRFQQELGRTTGTYRLIIRSADETTAPTDTDPLTAEPEFGVEYEFIAYEEFKTGSIDATNTRRYFALGGRQGEFVRMVINTTEGDLQPDLRILDDQFLTISQVAQQSNTQMVIYAAIPQTGWYLVEATRRAEGSGRFTVYTTLLTDTVLTSEAPVAGTFSPDTTTLSYVFNATINERVFFTLIVTEGQDIVPELRILNLQQESLASRQSQGIQTSVAATTPRSGSYIVQVRNAGDASAGGRFELTMRRDQQSLQKLRVQDIEYNNRYKGEITDSNPIDYYRFSGKAGELVTLEMQPAPGTSPQLDPYLILTDSNLTELTFSDNTAASRGARIAQFALEADGDYLILATRPRLSRGSSTGAYEMSITVGQISLLPGGFTATLRWQGAADLNLFVREPGGRTISWANPSSPNGGLLQIDSNTGCITPTAQPVEHIYYPQADLPTGDYTVWVWYQTVCGSGEPVRFNLTLEYNRQTIIAIDSSQQESTQLVPQERFEASFRLDDGQVQLINTGSTTTPSPQQRASQGGDTLIVYGRELTGTITDAVYAQFYQFEASAGDTITVTAETVTGNLDPIVVLRDALDRNLARDDDSGSNRDAQLQYTIEESGQYVIAVTRYGLRNGTTTGDYRLRLERR